MSEERVLGFDVREWVSAPELWDAARRERFLLRPDVAQPLSVDTMVWPSAFDSGQGIGLTAAERARLHLAGIPLPSWTGPTATLWEDAERMLRYLGEHEPAPGRGAVIVVTRVSESGFGDDGPSLAATDLAGMPAPGRRLLGFDVADGSSLSGLSNCGYTAGEAERLGQEFGQALNEWHLFAEAEPALKFCAAADDRVPEHAPFFVYGLYLIEEIGG